MLFLDQPKSIQLNEFNDLRMNSYLLAEMRALEAILATGADSIVVGWSSVIAAVASSGWKGSVDHCSLSGFGNTSPSSGITPDKFCIAIRTALNIVCTLNVSRTSFVVIDIIGVFIGE